MESRAFKLFASVVLLLALCACAGKQSPGIAEQKFIGQARIYLKTDVREAGPGIHFVILDDGRDGVNLYEALIYLSCQWKTMNSLIENMPVIEGKPVFFPSFEAYKELLDIGTLRIQLKPWVDRIQDVDPKALEKKNPRIA